PAALHGRLRDAAPRRHGMGVVVAPFRRPRVPEHSGVVAALAPGPAHRRARARAGVARVIEDLEVVLAASGQPALSELRSALGQALDAATSSVACIEQRKLKSRVHRLRFRAGGRVLSVVAKRLESDVAKRCELLARRWLPAEGLEAAAPRLIAASPASEGWVWHVYEDLGEETLEHRPERDRVEAAVNLVARLHTRFTSHPLLAEVRAASEERGI